MSKTITILTLGLQIMLTSLTLTSCDNHKTSEKPALLKAAREAPLGWVYLTIYNDSTFEFTLTGVRSDNDIYKGNVEIRSDSMFFKYTDSIPKAGTTAIFNDKIVSYIDGKYPETLQIGQTKLTKN